MNKDSTQSAETSSNDVKTKNKSSSEKSNDFPEKESKLSSKPMNLKRNNKKKVSKKKVNAGDSRLNGSLATSSTHKSEAEHKNERLSDLKVEPDEIKNSKDADFIDAKVDGDTADSETFKILNTSNNSSAVNRSGSVEAQTELEVSKVEDVLMTENVVVPCGPKEKQKDLELVEDTMKQVEKKEQIKKLKQLENDRSSTSAVEDEVSENVELQNHEEIKAESENSQKFVVKRMTDLEANENLLDKNDDHPKSEQDWLVESIQNSDLFSSVPVAASTPQKKEPSDVNTDNSGSKEPLQSNTGDDKQLSNINDLLKESEILSNQNVEHGLDVEDKAEEDVSSKTTMINEETEVKKEISDLTSNQVGRLLQGFIFRYK